MKNKEVVSNVVVVVLALIAPNDLTKPVLPPLPLPLLPPPVRLVLVVKDADVVVVLDVVVPNPSL